MANGKIRFGKQSGGQLTLVIPDGVSNTEVIVPESGILATTQYVDDEGALKVALADFIGTNVSLATNGYQKFPGGLIIQWGTQTPPANTVVQTYNFPLVFPTNCLTFVASLGMGGNSGTGKNDGTGGKYISSSQYQMVNYTVSSIIKIDWIAIGY